MLPNSNRSAAFVIMFPCISEEKISWKRLDETKKQEKLITDACIYCINQMAFFCNQTRNKIAKMDLYRSSDYQTSDPYVGPFLSQGYCLNKSACYFQWSFESIGLLVQKKRLEIDFQDGNYGGHLGYSIRTILAIIYLQVTPIRSTKSQVNSHFSSGE